METLGPGSFRLRSGFGAWGFPAEITGSFGATGLGLEFRFEGFQPSKRWGLEFRFEGFQPSKRWTDGLEVL